MARKKQTDLRSLQRWRADRVLLVVVLMLTLLDTGCTKWVLREGDGGAIDAAADAGDATDAASDSDLDADATVTDADDEGDADDSGDLCPPGMVLIASGLAERACIDAYEASCSSGTCPSPDVATDEIPRSAADEEPWVEITKAGAVAACKRAAVVIPGRGELNKSLCTVTQWRVACSGGDAGLAFPYGQEYDAGACSVHGDSPVSTGASSRCEGGFSGIFDMSGNVREWVVNSENEELCPFLGGSYNDGDHLLGCSSSTRELSAEDSLPDLGFRCCLVIPTD